VRMLPLKIGLGDGKGTAQVVWGDWRAKVRGRMRFTRQD